MILREKWEYDLNPNELHDFLKKISIEEKSNILDLMSIYRLKLWFDNINNLPENLKNILINFEELNDELPKIIGTSLAKKSADSWMREYINEVEKGNVNFIIDFPKLFLDYKLWNNLSNEVFKNYLWSSAVDLSFILKNKKIVDERSELILDNLMNNEKYLFINIDLVLGQNNQTFHFPKKFKNSSCFQNMVENLLNYFEEIGSIAPSILGRILDFNNSNFPLDPRIKSRIEILIEHFWEDEENNPLIQKFNGISLGVELDEYMHKNYEMEYSRNTRKFKLNKNWLESVDNENLISYLLKLIMDELNRPISINKTDIKNNSLLEMVISSEFNSKRKYRDDFNTMIDDIHLNLILKISLDFFVSKGIFIEVEIMNYFNSIIEKNFGIKGFFMNKIDPYLPYESRVKLLSIEFESILKQFVLLTTYNQIDLNYLKYMIQLDIEEIKSLKDKKYFSISQAELKENFELYFNWREYFEKHNYLSYELVVSRDDMEAFKKFKSYQEESTLFSKQESDFLNYCINNKKYDNALAIRNTYLHGTTSHLNEEEHEWNYIVIIKCFMIAISKINEEISLL
ncbi:hypothetical protein [Vagococcus fluvialis]|uniref:hypothetical protein n=1 Tax=Vagococcus fluvialis TaxID=2738 RepID=UPI0037CF46B1